MAETTDAAPIWLIFAIFPLALGTMFFLVGNLLAALGGWKALAAAYPPTEEPPGERFAWRSMRIGWVNYNNCVNLVAGRFGLHFSMVFLLRLGHPPFYVPWSEITVTCQKGWIFEYIQFYARKAPGVRLRLLRGQAEQILRAAGQPVPQPPGR